MKTRTTNLMNFSNLKIAKNNTSTSFSSNLNNINKSLTLKNTNEKQKKVDFSEYKNSEIIDGDRMENDIFKQNIRNFSNNFSARNSSFYSRKSTIQMSPFGKPYINLHKKELNDGNISYSTTQSRINKKKRVKIILFIFIHFYSFLFIFIHFYSFLFIFIHFYSFLFIFIHFYSFLFIFIHFYSFLFIFIHFYSFLFIFIHFYSFLFIFIHFYSFLFIFIHFYSKNNKNASEKEIAINYLIDILEKVPENSTRVNFIPNIDIENRFEIKIHFELGKNFKFYYPHNNFEKVCLKHKKISLYANKNIEKIGANFIISRKNRSAHKYNF